MLWFFSFKSHLDLNTATSKFFPTGS